MSTDTNKAVVLTSIDEGWNMQHISIFDQLFAPDLIDHSVPPCLPQTRSGTKQLATRTWIAFPDFHVTVEDQVAEGDRVVTRWTARGTNNGELLGAPPTGKGMVLTGISIARLVGGKITETWAEIGHPRVCESLADWQRLQAVSGGR
jgi:predicted ester cyclase